MLSSGQVYFVAINTAIKKCELRSKKGGASSKEPLRAGSTLLPFCRLSAALITERFPGFESDHFFSGVRQAGDLPRSDGIDKLFRYAVIGLVDIFAHIPHDGEERMLQVILPHELKDIETAFR